MPDRLVFRPSLALCAYLCAAYGTTAWAIVWAFGWAPEPLTFAAAVLVRGAYQVCGTRG